MSLYLRVTRTNKRTKKRHVTTCLAKTNPSQFFLSTSRTSFKKVWVPRMTLQCVSSSSRASQPTRALNMFWKSINQEPPLATWPHLFTLNNSQLQLKARTRRARKIRVTRLRLLNSKTKEKRESYPTGNWPTFKLPATSVYRLPSLNISRKSARRASLKICWLTIVQQTSKQLIRL